MGVLDEAERLHPATLDEWTAWLERHHATTQGVWLVNWKASTGKQAFDYEASVIEALRFGWVDSTRRTVDDERTMMWFARRRKGSLWTRINKGRVAALEAEGRMEPAGRAAVEAAKATDAWTLLDDADDLIVPDDLAAAFAAHPGAAEHWETFSPSRRKQILAWIVMAKRPETRATRVTTTAVKAQTGEPSQ